MHVLVFLLAALMAPVQTASAPPLTWSRPDHFWFRKAVPGGHLWLTVDAPHGVKEPLFDHGRLAIELNARTGLEFTALTLPFADPAAEFVVHYDGSNAYVEGGAMVIEFTLDDRRWHCDLQIKWNWNLVPPTDYECAAANAGRSSGAPARRQRAGASPDRRWEAVLVNHNVVVLRERRAPPRRGARPAQHRRHLRGACTTRDRFSGRPTRRRSRVSRQRRDLAVRRGARQREGAGHEGDVPRPQS